MAGEIETLQPAGATRISRAAADPGNLFHMRRQFDDGELLFLVNTSIEQPSRGAVESPLQGVEAWDLEDYR